MNPGRAPGRVLRHQLEDQILNVLRELLPSDSISYQRTTVSCVTIMRERFQSDQKRRAVTQKSLS